MVGAAPATMAEVLAARSGDDGVALRFENQRWGWHEVVRAGAVRAALARTFRHAGPFHVGVLLENVPEHALWWAAACLSELTLVALNPTRGGAELERDIAHADCQLVITDAAHAGQLAGAGLESDRVLLVDSPAYTDLLAGHAHTGMPPTPPPESLLALFFTSGSTGAPKAVKYSQGRMAASAGVIPELLGLTGADVFYLAMPLFHGNSVITNWCTAMRLGATVVLRRRFSASGFLPDVHHYGATYFNYVGTAVSYILATPPNPDDADNPLRVCFGTEAGTRDRRRFEERFGCDTFESYGSSEGVISIRPTPDTPQGALGPLPEGVTIADRATLRECPPARFDDHGRLANAGEAVGEIAHTRGLARFEGYYNNPDADAERSAGGWYFSGDLAYRDQQGFAYFAGRSGEMIRVHGENLTPWRIETALTRFPGAALACTYAVPHAHSGDEVMAALALEDGADFDPAGFAEFLATQQDLSPKAVPRYVRVTHELPLTAAGKVSRAHIRRQGWWAAAPDDVVYWQPDSQRHTYQRMTSDDAAALRQQFAEQGREHLLGI